jgi:hypothetical protein
VREGPPWARPTRRSKELGSFCAFASARRPRGLVPPGIGEIGFVSHECTPQRPRGQGELRRDLSAGPVAANRVSAWHSSSSLFLPPSNHESKIVHHKSEGLPQGRVSLYLGAVLHESCRNSVCALCPKIAQLLVPEGIKNFSLRGCFVFSTVAQTWSFVGWPVPASQFFPTGAIPICLPAASPPQCSWPPGSTTE